MKKCRLAFTVLLTAVCWCVSVYAECPKQLRDLDLKDMQGKKTTLSCAGHSVLVINLWATWCIPCRIEIPRLIELYREFGDKGVSIVGISVDALPPAELKPFVKTFNIPYPIYIGKARDVLSGIGIMAVPATLILDSSGNIKRKLVGLHTTDELRGIIKDLLGQGAEKN